MRTYPECFPCFLRQTLIALDQYADSGRRHEEIIKAVLPVMAGADTSKPPAYTTTFIHRLIREQLGEDPFMKLKFQYNEIAMGLYPKMKETVKKSRDPLWSAARLAIAGNVIDFGIYATVDIEGSVRRALEEAIAVDDYDSFSEALSEAEGILYLLDNCGEIAFDRLLVEELVSMGKKVTAVVKGSPVLNDVTHDDAIQVGLDRVCHVIDNGSDAVGTILEMTPPGFLDVFNKTDLVISKGQGNFETLMETGKKTFFLFQSKCDLVSKELGLSPGSMLLKRSLNGWSDS
jgi:uncharacterized protein with ATP-grasp and redox domains